MELKVKIKKVVDKFPLRELISYAWVGLVGVGLDAGIFAVLRHYDIHPVLATIISSLSAAALTFPLNLKFTFKKSDDIHKRFVAYLGINTFGMVLGAVIVYVGYDLLNLKAGIAKAISVVVVAGTQFLLNKFIAFK